MFIQTWKAFILELEPVSNVFYLTWRNIFRTMSAKLTDEYAEQFYQTQGKQMRKDLEYKGRWLSDDLSFNNPPIFSLGDGLKMTIKGQDQRNTRAGS
ncbi:hypothetical protein AVEN_9896-1 [Araneus ventricosus]|uniref:Uncharacterized protein n=1 Tax=Araneus ventricosus TaxID=182803 RepID=A0A4Y2UKN8_ARAVE|nr:hypothetical protein AVEN_9896-1 [Araneus ventricosus]